MTESLPLRGVWRAIALCGSFTLTVCILSISCDVGSFEASDNSFGSVGTTALAEMLEVNHTLQELYLAGVFSAVLGKVAHACATANRIGVSGAQRLALAIGNNWGLLRLDIER